MPFRDGDGAWHVDGAAWGIVPNGTAPLLDATPDCSTSMAAAPWLAVALPVQDILGRLVSLGDIEAGTLGGAVYTGGVVVGPETWGRHWTVADLKERVVVLRGR